MQEWFEHAVPVGGDRVYIDTSNTKGTDNISYLFIYLYYWTPFWHTAQQR